MNKESLHDMILSNIMSFKVITKKLSEDVFFGYSENESRFVDFKKKEIYVEFCTDDVVWYKEGKLNFVSQCHIEVEDVVDGIGLVGKHRDAYGTILTNQGLLLNNYDAGFYEQEKNEKGFCNVIGFATVTQEGVVRFSQVVYSFKFCRLIIRDDVRHRLPYQPDLMYDFNGKRAVYRYGSKLTIRTTLDVYAQLDKKYWQSEKYKHHLSYPRLVLLG